MRIRRGVTGSLAARYDVVVLGGGLAMLGSMAAKAEKKRLVQQAAVDHAAVPAPAALA